MIRLANKSASIEIGRIGENDAVVVRFDVADILSEFPDAVISLLNKRYGDPAAYPVNPEQLSVHDGVLDWTVKNSDVSKVGRGECELIATQDSVIVKDDIYPTRVSRALDNSEEPPEPWESWVQDIMDAATEAMAAAEESETNVTHYPKVVDNYWYVWDAVEADWVSTGVCAHGERGEPGPAGATGATGEAGPEGERGPDGNGIESIEMNEDYTLTITFTDGESYTTESIRGERGATGATGEVSKAMLDSGLAAKENPQYKMLINRYAASITDGGLGLAVKSLQLGDFYPYNDFHGYSYPWPGGAKKNKLPMVLDDIKSLNTDGTWSGNVYTLNGMNFEVNTDNDDNVTAVTVYGQASANTKFALCGPVSYENATIMNGAPATSGVNKYSLNAYMTENTSLADHGEGYNIAANTSFIGVKIYVHHDISIDKVVFYPMIRLATEADATFEPYSNICKFHEATNARIARTNSIPVTGMPQNGVYTFTYTQSGSGTASPTNIRNITPGLRITRDDNSELVAAEGTLHPSSGTLTITKALFVKNSSTMNVTMDTPGAIGSPGWQNCGVLDIVGVGVSSELTGQVLNVGSVLDINTIYPHDILVLPYDKYKKTLDYWQAAAKEIQIVIPYETPLTIQLSPAETERALAYLGIEGKVWTVEWPEAGVVYGGNLDPIAGKLTAKYVKTKVRDHEWTFYRPSSGYTAFYTIDSNKKKGEGNVSADAYRSAGTTTYVYDNAIFGTSVSSYILITDSKYGTDVESFVRERGDVDIVYELNNYIEYDIDPSCITLSEYWNTNYISVHITNLNHSISSIKYPVSLPGLMDRKADKVIGATGGNLAALDSYGNIADSGKKASDFVPTTRKINNHALSDDVTVTKDDVGLGNVDNTSDASKPVSTATQTALDGKASKVANATSGNFAGLDSNGGLTDSGHKHSDYLTAAEKGAANGVAELNENGKVPSEQLPSYVDDVREYADTGHFPLIGESGIIYVALDTNKTYRWSGSEYVEISTSLALGETSSTAYRGDRGKAAYDHATDSGRLTTAQASGLYKVAVTAEGHVAGVDAVAKSDITALGIPAQDTTYSEATTSAAGLMSAADKTKLNGLVVATTAETQAIITEYGA